MDSSQRNRLLNFRPNGKGVIKLVEPDAPTLYSILTESEKPLTFYRPPQVEETQLVLLDEAELAKNGAGAAEPVPSVPPPLKKDEIRAEATGGELERLLYRTYLKARGSQAEQGVNILFATFGLLRWQETPTSSDSFAPLILVPVQLTRASALDSFQISALDEELSLNPTLVEKLRTQFDVTLTLGDEDLRQPLSSVLSTLQTALERQPGWQVSPDVYLGLFQFHKLSMYRDLTPTRRRLRHILWSERLPANRDKCRDPRRTCRPNGTSTRASIRTAPSKSWTRTPVRCRQSPPP